MKMTLKAMALMLAALITLTSFSFVALADDRDVIVVYPGFKANGRTTLNGDGTPSGGGKFMYAYLSDTAGTSGFPATDSRISRNKGTAQTSTSNTTGFTYFTPATFESHTGFIYKPCASSATSTDGWYDVYVERLLYYDGTDSYSAPDAIHVDVIHRDGIAHYLMDMTPNTNYTVKTKYSDLVKIGTFYFNDANSHQVRLFSPIDKSVNPNKVRFDFGGVMFVPAENAPETKGYYNPVFSDDFSDGISASWYEAVGSTSFNFSSNTADIPVGSSLKINYAEGEDAAEAVKFTEGAINFKLWWRNTGKNDAYTSVILGKSANSNAEFRIYSEKVEYVENNVVKCEIPIHGYYAYYYNNDTLAQHKNTLSGYYDTDASKSYYPHMMRIEISDPEALSETGNKITNNLKTVKVVVNYGTSDAYIMAMGSLPADSILNNMDADDPTDNYIEFKNSTGDNDIDIKDISIMVPDEDITSTAVYANIINGLKYIKSKDELNIYDGTLGASAEVSKPAEITNTLLKSNSYTGMAIMAPFKSGELSGAPVVKKLELMPGTKKRIYMTLNSDPDFKGTIKYFIWDSFDDLVPAKEVESTVIY